MGLIRNIIFAALVLALGWWLVFGLTDRQIDAFQKTRAEWLGHAKEAQGSVKAVQDDVKDAKKTATKEWGKIKK